MCPGRGVCAAFLTLGGSFVLGKGLEGSHQAVGLVAVLPGLAKVAALILAAAWAAIQTADLF